MIDLEDFTNYIIRKEGGANPGTIGYKLNNPGNLRFAGQKDAEPDPSGFARFSSMEAGIEALKRQIALDASRGHTLRSFISKYAPPSENDTETYISQISQWSGLKDTDVLQDSINLGPTSAGQPQGSRLAGELYPSWEETKASLPKDIPDSAYDALRERYFSTYIRPQVLKEGSNVTATREEFMKRTAREGRSEWPRASLLGASVLSGLAEAPLGLLAKHGLVKDSPLQKLAEAGYEGVKGLRESAEAEARQQEVPGAGAIGFAGEMIGNLPYFAGGASGARGVATGLLRRGLFGGGEAAVKGAAEMAAKFSAGEMTAGVAAPLAKKGLQVTPEMLQAANADALEMLLGRARMLKLDQASLEPLIARATAGDLQPLASKIGAETAILEKTGQLSKFIIPEAIGLVQGAYDAGRAEPGKELQAAAQGFALGAGTAAAFESIGPLYRLLKGRLNVSDETAQAIANTAVGAATPEQAEAAAKAAFQDPRVAREVKWVVENRVRVLKALGNPKIPDSVTPGGPLKVNMRGADGKVYSFSIKDAAASGNLVARMWKHFNRGGELISLEGEESDIALLRSRLDDQLKAAGAYDLPVVLRNETPADAATGPKLLLPHFEDAKKPEPVPKTKKAKPAQTTPAEPETPKPAEDLKTLTEKGEIPAEVPQPAKPAEVRVFRDAKITNAEVMEIDGQKVPYADFHAGDYAGNATLNAKRTEVLIQLDGSDEIIHGPFTIRDKTMRDMETSITEALSKKFGAPRMVTPKDVPVLDKIQKQPNGMFLNVETGKLYPSKTMALNAAGVLAPSERRAVYDPLGPIARYHTGLTAEPPEGLVRSGSSLGTKARPFWDRTVETSEEKLPSFAATTYSNFGERPYLRAKKEFLTPAVITHEALHAEIGTLGLAEFADTLLKSNPVFQKLWNSFNAPTKRLYKNSPWKMEEVLAYLTQAIRHENTDPNSKRLIEHFIWHDKSREELLADVAEVYRFMYAKSRIGMPDSPQLRRFQRSAVDMLWRTGGMGDFVQNVERSGDLIHFSDGQWHIYNSRRDAWLHFDSRENLTTHLLETYAEPLSAPELVNVSDFNDVMEAVFGWRTSYAAPKPTRRGVLGSLFGGAVKPTTPEAAGAASDAKVVALTKALSERSGATKALKATLESMLTGLRGDVDFTVERVRKDGLVELRGIFQDWANPGAAPKAKNVILDPQALRDYVRGWGTLDADHQLSLLYRLEKAGIDKDKLTEMFFTQGPLGEGIQSNLTFGGLLESYKSRGEFPELLKEKYPEAVKLVEQYKSLSPHEQSEVYSSLVSGRLESLQERPEYWRQNLEQAKEAAKRYAEYPERYSENLRKARENQLKALRAGTVTPGMELQRTPLGLGEAGQGGVMQRYAVIDPISVPRGPKSQPSPKIPLPAELQPAQPVKEGWDLASFWVTPFYDWVSRVAKKNDWPQLYDAFDKVKQASLGFDTELGQWIQKIKKTGLLRVGYEKRVDLAEFLRTPEEKQPDFIAKHHLTPKDVEMAKKIRGLYDEGYTATEVKAPYLENYIFRVREPDFKVDGMRPTSRYTKADIDFAADHHRTKEIDLTDRDVLSNLYNYLRLGLRRKYLKTSIKDAQAIVNAQNEDGTFVLGSFQPLFKRHLDLMLSRPDRTAIAIRRVFTSVIEGINGAIEAVNKRTGLKLDPITIGEDPSQRFLLYSYAGTLGLRPMVPIRDSMQLFLTTYPLLGGKYLSRGFQRAFPGIRNYGAGSVWEEAERAGALMAENPIHNVIAGSAQTVESSTLGRTAEWLLKPLMISNNANRLIAYYGHKEKALDALTDYAIHHNAKKLASRSGIVFLDEQLTQRFLREAEGLAPSRWDSWAQRVAKEMVDISQWNYHRGASPGLYKWAVGRMFGQYGTWPLNYIAFARRLLTRGDPSDRALAIARLMAAHSATLMAGAEVGIDTGQWVFTQPGAYAGGPLTQFVLDAPQALDFESFRGEEARRDLKRLPTLFIPGAMTASRLWSAANTSPEDTFKLLMGFSPMKKGEEERGMHQFLPSEE